MGRHRQAHCKAGHDYSVVGVYEFSAGKYIVRRCRACTKLRDLSMSSEARLKKRKSNKLWRELNLSKAQAQDREAKRAWNLSHVEEHRLRVKNWRVQNPEKANQKDRRQRAGRRQAKGFFTDMEWLSLCAQCNYKCLCCGLEKELEKDHVIPLSKGGRDTIDNIQPLCKSCNCKKGTKSTDYRVNSEQRFLKRY